MKKKLLFSLFIFFAIRSFAFLPPLLTLVRDPFENRSKPLHALYTFFHRLKGSQGSYELEEQVMEERGKIFSLFRVNGQTVSCLLEAQSYQFGKDKIIPARSAVFLNYYISVNPDTFLNLLFQEDFARRDQTYQLKPGAPEKVWNLKDYYLRQDDIFLSRLPQGISIAVQGSLESNLQRTVYFDRTRKQINRIEWKEGAQKYFWSFGPTTRFSYGSFPRKAQFFKGEEEWFVSDFQGMKNLSEKAMNDWKNLWKNSLNRFNSDSMSFLKQFVTYR